MNCRLMRSVIFLATICVWFIGLPADAHVEDQFNSVHFHNGQPDFGTPPRRGILTLRGEEDDRPIDNSMGSYRTDRDYVELSDDTDQWRRARRLAAIAARMKIAERFLQKGHWAQARVDYEALAHQTGMTGELRDQLEVLAQAQKTKTTAMQSTGTQTMRYFHALDLDDQKQRGQAKRIFKEIPSHPAAPFLAAHALYQIASLDYEDRQFSLALTTYQSLLNQYPRTEKREATLLMIARCALLPQRKELRSLAVGKDALAQIAREFPKTRFRRSVLGLQGRSDYLRGEYDDAARIYLALDDLSSVRMVSGFVPEPGRSRVRAALFARYLAHLLTVAAFQDYEQTARQIDILRQAFTPVEARLFSQLILEQPKYASPYFYYRLYLCDDTSKDLMRLAHFADLIVARHPHDTALSPEICTRFAEVYYQSLQYAKGLTWANRSLESASSDRALFVRGAIAQHMGRNRAATHDFARMLALFPNSLLRRSAREELAITDEALGDLGGSLDQYFALAYQYDIAFFLDARMSLPQVQRYVLNHADTSRRGLLFYSLGMRCLRAERWADAVHWLNGVPHAQYLAYTKTQSDWDQTLSPTPLVAARRLAALQRRIIKAHTPSQRAEAMLADADYYYTHGTLLLYNNALWQGDRATSFSFWWNARHATALDTQTARDHMYQHEVYARAMTICLDIAKRYPDTPAAPRALYRAACCARRLANFNDWWREEDKRAALWHHAAHWMNEVARRYPRSPLAHNARKYAYVFTEEQKSPW